MRRQAAVTAAEGGQVSESTSGGIPLRARVSFTFCQQRASWAAPLLSSRHDMTKLLLLLTLPSQMEHQLQQESLLYHRGFASTGIPSPASAAGEREDCTLSQGIMAACRAALILAVRVVLVLASLLTTGADG